MNYDTPAPAASPTSVAALLGELHARDIRLWCEGAHLRLRVPKGQEDAMAALRPTLAAHKAELMALLSAGEAAAAGPGEEPSGATDGARLVPVPRDRDLPLSFAQQRLWFLAQIQESAVAYNESAGLILTGALDVPALEASLTEICRRHEILRTGFPQRDGSPLQVVAPPAPLRLPLEDLRGLPEAEQSAAVQRVAAADAAAAFDLARPPLLRLRLLQLADTPAGVPRHVLLATLHHILADMWSMGILNRELSILYRAYREGRPAPLPELTVQYADYACRQRERLRGSTLERHLAYWRRQLADAPALLVLPTDHPRPPVQGFDGARVPIALAADQLAAVRRLCRATGTTLFMVLLAVFAVLLRRWSGQTSIVIGAPVANRDEPLTEPLIGFFVNTLALRIDLSADPAFERLLGRVRTTVLDALSHQELPFEKLVEELKPPRNLAYAPLFQVMLALRNVPVEALRLPDLSLTPLPRAGTVAKFDLTLELNETPAGVAGFLEYNTRLFTSERAARLAAQFGQLVSTLTERPAESVARVPLLTPDELRALRDWSVSPRPLEVPSAPLSRLIAAQVRRAPQALALSCGDTHLSFGALDARANRIARLLAARGVRPGALVALYLERSPDLVAALLGILKAGAAYLPLDPAAPAQRLALIIADADADLLLTQSRLGETLPAAPVPILCLDREAETLAGLSPDDLPDTPAAAGRAYTIYTSGSTGRPKGVEIGQPALLSLLCAMQQELALTPADTWLAVTTIAFDIAALELWLPLLVGAHIVVMPQGQTGDGERLAARLADGDITVMQATPATWRLLLAAGWTGTPGLTMVCGGESLPTDLARALLEKGRVLYNVYGPTETTVWSTCARVTAAQVAAGRIPIGRPLANTRVYVLDPNGQQVPMGVGGELYLAGLGLARGYPKRPELTAERFVELTLPGPEPEAPPPPVRLYRTGDQVRFLPDGSLEYLGRLDRQLKLRGFRLEPGEIEAVLAEHPGVAAVAVLLEGDAPEDQRLVAYLSPRAGQTPAAADLRAFLKPRLPDYMIPAAFAVLADLPLTPNGKLDHGALAGRAGSAAVSPAGAGFVPPRTERELRLARLWEEILGVHPIGVHDDFFALGGHSFLAVKLISRLNHSFGTALPIATLFGEATVAQLAQRIARGSGGEAWRSLVALQPRGERTPLFCMHPAGGTVFRYTTLAHRLGEQRPFYGLQGRGIEPGQTPHADVPAMAAAYIEELRGVAPHGPYLLAGWSSGGTTAFEMAVQLEAAGEEVALVLMFDTPAPIDISYETDDIAFLLERLPAQGIALADLDQYTTYDDQLGYIFGEIKRARPLMDFDVAEGKRFLGVYKHHNQIMCEYRPPRPARAPILYLKAAESLPYDRRMGEPIAGWRPLTQGGLTVETIPGNHFNILEAADGQALADTITRHLDGRGL